MKGDFWRNILQAILVPTRRSRLQLTSLGAGVLVFAAVSGAGAYALGSNTLIVTFCVLLSAFALSWIMSWLNLRGLKCRLNAEPSLRAGAECLVNVSVFNTRSVLFAQGVWACVHCADGALARLWIGRVDARGEANAQWRLKLERRGVMRLEIAGLSSAFPFGFLKKAISSQNSTSEREVLVWPATVEYRHTASWSPAQSGWGESSRHAGQGGDLHALRDYRTGDALSQIYWRASARTGRLLVREFAAEKSDGLLLRVITDVALWPHAEQFELMCSLAATLAEDCFASGQLRGVQIDGVRYIAVRRSADMGVVLDALALVERTSGPPKKNSSGGKNVMTFAPDGARGVRAYVNGNTAAMA